MLVYPGEVEILQGAYEWQEYLLDLQVGIQGMAITQCGQDVCHAFRLLRRHELPQLTIKGVWPLMRAMTQDHME